MLMVGWLAQAYFFCKLKRCRRTPFDRQRMNVASSSKNAAFDLFISYKSEDVMLARWLSEQLIAAGIKVWFVEYCIPMRRQEDFQQFIDEGCHNSKSALFITNERFVSSVHCCGEVERLLQRPHSTKGMLLEICNPKEPLLHEKYTGMLAARHFDYTGTSSDALRFVLESLGRRYRHPTITSEHPQRETFSFGVISYSLDMTGWDIKSRGDWWTPKAGNEGGPKFSKRIGGMRVSGNLIVGESDLKYPDERFKSNNDREKFKAARKYAEQFFPESSQDDIGLHLIIVGNTSHAGFTTFTDQHNWCRRYSVVLPSPKDNVLLEFAFVFFAVGPFKSFCRVAGLFDRMVESLIISGVRNE
ncbi:toll/interleukin-1 receptor domain-containing protein [Oligosphaera ethanolica]|uniref:TIR domain-containing protein n=1 Tax=Oligosphaera ethanolica TaxID=760260 RepID=A0AAE3VHX4_9BACT|nr:toll/interleukin-1 receptor domain-containing protein [Oligosphaera ethanolica]MDQ0290586.1 hypothetical protein [Oligosphaera ethanolica]